MIATLNPEQLLGWARNTRPVRFLRRIDGGTLTSFYVMTLTIIPAKLVLKGVSLDLAPTMLLGLFLGVCWFCAQLVSTLGMAKGRSVVRTALFIYAVTQLLTYGSANSAGLPADELKATDRTTITLFSVIGVGLLVCDGVRGWARVDRLLKFIVIGATFMGAIGILQFVLNIDLTAYLSLPGLRSVADHGSVLDRSIFRRPAGTAGHPIEYGVMCALTLPLAMHYAVRSYQNQERNWWRWWFCFLVIAAGLMFSLSRSAILGAAVAVLVLFPSWTWKRRIQLVVAAGVFLVIMRLLIPGLVGTIYSLFSNFNNDVSIQGRTEDYGPATIEISRHLLFGRGVGTFLPEKYTWLDNQYLMTIVENGVVGLVAFSAVLLSGVYAALRTRALSNDPTRRDLCLSLVASIAVSLAASATFDLLAYSMITGITFVLVGACGALLRDATNYSKRSRNDHADKDPQFIAHLA